MIIWVLNDVNYVHEYVKKMQVDTHAACDMHINFSFDLYTATTTYTVYDILDTAICMIWFKLKRQSMQQKAMY